MNRSDLDHRLLRHVNRPDYRPVKPRVLAKQLKLSADQQTELKRSIKRLVKSGQLIYAANHLVQSVERLGRNEVVGTFRRAMAGYGFVRPQGTSKAVGRGEDVYVPAAKAGDAATGDLVRVKTQRRGQRDGKPRVTGEVVAVVRRASAQFVGTYQRAELDGETQGVVQIDGTDFTLPIVVGDAGAKGAQPDDKVVVELVRYPTATRMGEGVIVEVLGARGQPGVDTLSILREFALPEAFPEDVLEAARQVAAQFDGTIPADRRDLTGLTVVTIDPVDARDFDDAISLERLENGHWQLGVHIADVSHFVRPQTPLDREARERATSVYLPDRVIPMLPEVISNHLASLQPRQVRFTKTAFIEYAPDGIRVAADFCQAAIRSARRLTYEEVDEFLADRPAARVRFGADVYRLLENMHWLAMLLRQRRMDRGSIELNLPEIKIQLDREGRVCGADRIERTESHQIIEEFMLAANESVAQRLQDLEMQSLRRIHESPDPMKLATLTDFVRELGIDCEHLENRFEIKRVLALVAKQPLEHAVNYAVLRAMQKAVYSPADAGHYALAFEDYCHFTSPIRRYPDLTIHRLLASIFRGQMSPGDTRQLTQLGEHCSEREQRAEAAERELVKLKLLHFLVDRVGESMDVVVTGVEDFGLFAQGIQLPAEGLIHVNSLDDDHYRFDSDTHSLTGYRVGNRYRLGDLLRVQIARVDLERRELDFIVLERLAPGALMKDVFAGHASKKAVGKVASRGRTKARAAGDSKRRGRHKQRAQKSDPGPLTGRPHPSAEKRPKRVKKPKKKKR